jgi:hypothetical protein
MKKNKDEEYAKEGEVYEEIFREKNEETNVVKIAGRSEAVYNQTILNKLQKFDQVVISVLDTWLEKAIYIIRKWEAVGVMPEKGNPIRFEKKEEDIISKDGKKFNKMVNKITLTKLPEMYRFTNI